MTLRPQKLKRSRQQVLRIENACLLLFGEAERFHGDAGIDAREFNPRITIAEKVGGFGPQEIK
jgi:hypothetical protein